MALVIVIVFIMDVQPIDTRIVEKLRDFESRIENLEVTRQPYVADWQSLQASQFAYSTATKISTSQDFTSKLSIGDKLRIEQTTYKYMYITRVTATAIYVNAGDDYSVANAGITEIAFSNLASPSGFPSAFTYTPVYNIQGGSGVSVTVESVKEFSMVGEVITVSIGIVVGYDPGSPPTAFFGVSHPFILDPLYSGLRQFSGIANDGVAPRVPAEIFINDDTDLGVAPNSWGNVATEINFTISYPAKRIL